LFERHLQHDSLALLLLHSYNVDAGDTGIQLGCVVRVEPSLLEHSDLDLEYRDLDPDHSDLDVVRVDQLTAGTLLEDGEELVSNIIHIRASVVVSVRQSS